MIRPLLSLCVLAALAGSAAAEKKIQVLQADGRADAKVRAKIDTGVLALAKTTGDQIVPGDITFPDAAAAVGCQPDEAACKDEVLGMLSVDEIVITTVTPKPGGFEVAVRRVTKGGASRDATSFVAADKLDKLDTIAPLFSASAPPPAAPVTPPSPAVTPPSPAVTPPSPFLPTRPTTPPATTPVTPPATTPAITTTQPATPETAPTAPLAPSPYAVAEPRPSPIATPPGGVPRDDGTTGRPRLLKVGMAGGGSLLLVGLVLWASAASAQGEIDGAPVGTKAQLLALQELERKGDTYAGLGNLFVVGGLVLGGVSTYYFVKGNRRRASSARLVPAVFDRGGGLALAIGASP